MNIVDIKAESRDLKRKASSVRAEGKIPAILYGGPEQVAFSTTHNDVKAAVYTPDFKLTELDIDGKKYKSIVKSVQFHPVTDAIEHIDFLEIEDGRPVKVEIPVRFKGVSPGVKSGGKLIQSIRKIKVKADPVNLVDELFIDISQLELGFSVRIKDIQVPEGIEILMNPAIPVAIVEVPRALKSAAAKEETAAAATPATEE
jgi:large subunit ribosomal protein L25